MELPVSADIYFQDFASDLVDCTVLRYGTKTVSVKGLLNKERHERYIHLPIDTDVVPGDLIDLPDGKFEVKSVKSDTYMGKPELYRVIF